MRKVSWFTLSVTALVIISIPALGWFTTLDKDWHPLHRAAGPLFLIGLFLGPVIFLALWGGAFGTLILGARSLFRIAKGKSKDATHLLAALVAGLVLVSGVGPHLAIGWFVTTVLFVRLGQFIATRPRPSPRLLPWILMIALAVPSIRALPQVVSHVMVLFPVELADPPIQRYDRKRWTHKRAATYWFPDAESCLVDESDLRIDFRKVRTNAEAEVCLYRLLKSAGDIRASRAVLEAQRFDVARDGFSPESPFIGRDGNQRVAASWSIRQNGPRYPETGLLARYFRALPYSMSVNAYYSPDGSTCLAVRFGFNTL